jgi:putative peptidoglycan lipid II flippase
MGMLLYWGTGDLSPWLAAPAQERVARLFGWITAGSLTYLIAIVLLGIRPKQLLLVSRNGISSKD